ncbi:MAG: cyanoexosortase C [Synechococcales cyanobacterium CRU_2_2]|nr:cyanoexosortase C [Synechococcales cyanobacterium CRU_2_2]
MTFNTVQHYLVHTIRTSFSSFDRFLLLLATIIGIFYLPTWLTVIIRGIINGGSDCIINFGFLALAGQVLWRDRDILKTWKTNEEDRLIAHLIIISGILIFPFIRNSVSFQAVTFAWILTGVFLGQWGLKFFEKYAFQFLLILTAIYPDLPFIAIRVFRFFTGENLLERLMAWWGSWGLRVMGQQAVANSDLVTLPAGSVQVAPGCSGFAMAFTLAGTGLILGLFMALSSKKTALLITSGIAISLIFNVPRIMLLANAAVYWGEKSFEFWHGTWGGQIFASVMFTVYYYVAMAIIDSNAKKAKRARTARRRLLAQ